MEDSELSLYDHSYVSLVEAKDQAEGAALVVSIVALTA